MEEQQESQLTNHSLSLLQTFASILLPPRFHWKFQATELTSPQTFSSSSTPQFKPAYFPQELGHSSSSHSIQSYLINLAHSFATQALSFCSSQPAPRKQYLIICRFPNWFISDWIRISLVPIALAVSARWRQRGD